MYRQQQDCITLSLGRFMGQVAQQESAMWIHAVQSKYICVYIYIGQHTVIAGTKELLG